MRVLAFFLSYLASALSCSNIIISSKVSMDSSNIVGYNADSSTLYGSLYHYAAAKHEKGALRDIYDWDSGRYLGKIEEAQETFNVVGNVNEHGLIIGETTFGGLSELQSQSLAKIDYGSLIWVTLQRAKNAREAIHLLNSLMQTYGYASGGESFSIADQNEAWVMEIIGKGNFELGSVWVAVKLPDGAICGHANQARIQTFPLNDPERALYSKDVVSFAKERGYYPSTGSDEGFSFSDVYDPITFSGARICDARVWSFFSAVMGKEWSDQYLDYAMGHNLTNRMPLFVYPPEGTKISLADAMQHMRSHFEGTALDMSGQTFPDVAAVDNWNPQRAHPLTWHGSDGQTYTNERPIATQQTGWNFVAQSRRWMPRELAAVIWFGVDDSATTVRVPFYGSTTVIPASFAGKGAQDGVTPPMMVFDINSAFYAFNLVANWAYSRWSAIYPDVYEEITKKESIYMAKLADVDSKALIMYEQDPASAIQMVTQFSNDIANQLVKDWAGFFGVLFVRYRDGYRITANSENKACGCQPTSVAYPQTWYDRIVAENGDHFRVPESLKTRVPSVDKATLLQNI